MTREQYLRAKIEEQGTLNGFLIRLICHIAPYFQF